MVQRRCNHADRNTSRSLLPEAEGQERQVQCCRYLPEVYRSVTEDWQEAKDQAKMTRNALKAGSITEKSIREKLKDAKGDLFIAASLLGVTGWELDNYIRASKGLQVFAAAIEKVKTDPDYEKWSSAQFDESLELMTRAYRMEGLQIIREIANINERTILDDDGKVVNLSLDAASMKVKLDAAVQMRGAQEEQKRDDSIEATLQELNRLYHSHAPRITEIRQTVVTLGTNEKIINHVSRKTLK